MPTAEEILNQKPESSEYAALKDVDGQVLEIIDITPSAPGARYHSVVFTALTEAGEVTEFRTSSASAMDKLEKFVEFDIELPVKARVDSGPSSFPGKPWYDLVPLQEGES